MPQSIIMRLVCQGKRAHIPTHKATPARNPIRYVFILRPHLLFRFSRPVQPFSIAPIAKPFDKRIGQTGHRISLL